MRTSNLATRLPAAETLVLEAEIDFIAPGVERPFTYAHSAPPAGEAETARVHLDTAVSLLESMQMQYWLDRLALDRVGPS